MDFFEIDKPNGIHSLVNYIFTSSMIDGATYDRQELKNEADCIAKTRENAAKMADLIYKKLRYTGIELTTLVKIVSMYIDVFEGFDTFTKYGSDPSVMDLRLAIARYIYNYPDRDVHNQHMITLARTVVGFELYSTFTNDAEQEQLFNAVDHLLEVSS